MMTDVIVDLIKYFAKFPLKDGVLALFTRKPANEKHTGYNDLRDYITALPAGLIPGLEALIVSTAENDIKELVKSQNGYFLLLEYFQFNSSAPDKVYTRDTTFSLAVSVLHDHDKSGNDIIDEALIMDQCLNYILEINEFMKEDDSALCAWLRLHASKITITPVEPRFAWQNIGWVMTLEKQIDGLI